MANGSDSEDGLSDDRRRTIADVCSTHDFPLAEATVTGDVLRLTPTSVDALPDANDLGAIADELDAQGFRYVTFSVPSPDPDESS